MKRYKNPFEAAIEEERDESPPESPVSDSGRGVDGSEEDVGHLRQVKKLKTSDDNMEVDLTQIPTVEASDRDSPLNLVDESCPCDLSVINGYDCLRTLRAVEDRYPVRSDPLRSGRMAV
ncbi:hypothetical protein YC2023_004834 [Brassica napus]